MSKAVLLSTQPKWCEKICNQIGENKDGSPIYEKRVEVRKTRPKIDTPFKVYIYCTKNKRQWLRKVGTSVREVFITEPIDVLGRTDNVKAVIGNEGTFWERGGYNGKVIGEFVCKAILPISITYSDPNSKVALREFPFTCLTDKEIMDYLGNGKEGYGWCISDLVIYDEPKELSEFHNFCETYPCCDESCEYYSWTVEGGTECMCDTEKPFKRPPQSWRYVEELSE